MNGKTFEWKHFGKLDIQNITQNITLIKKANNFTREKYGNYQILYQQRRDKLTLGAFWYSKLKSKPNDLHPIVVI